ncbi:winged helix-turn-helix domain-containing protein [Amycolatopsis sp. NBC_01286]|uniref:winged helix-turn-helix domain-containing protein n=1 Tax=Amycolatopsis sp. NBC_01286 TaxID=2903560 RepID=UPI002E0F22D9|nr:winged helix-turn-helix domain-containing protein [Amycolatopsis sp. NBC_01286]
MTRLGSVPVRVLVTEDDEDIRLAVELALRDAGFAVDTAPDLATADEALFVNSYDCAVFDRKLPDGDSLGFVRGHRKSGWTVPVLFLTGHDSVADRVAGLAEGDDYLGKPFAVAELIARVRNLCRRAVASGPEVLRHGDLSLDVSRHEVHRSGVLVSLTAKEFAVVRRLLEAAGTTVTRRELEAAAWDELVAPTSNVLDVVIAQLRRKLGPPPIVRTVRGTGFSLS